MDLVILIILIVRIVKYANSKKLNPYRWGGLLTLNWFVFEFSGVILASYLLGIDSLLKFLEFMVNNPRYELLMSIFGLGCGFLGYFMTRKMMDRITV